MVKTNIAALAFFLSLFLKAGLSYSQTPVIGDIAPEIIFSKSLNKKITSANLKGKVVILDFWATWCAPCIASFPEINKLVEKYQKNPDVVFAALSYEPASKVEDFFIKRKKVLNALKLIDSDSLTNKRFSVTGFPQTFIVDKKGIIRWKGTTIDSLHPDIIDNIISTEYVKTSNPEVVSTSKPSSTGLSESLFKYLDSINNQPGMQFITSTVSTPTITNYFFDPGKVSGRFYIKSHGQKLTSIISNITVSQRKTSISTVNSEKGNIIADVIFKVEAGYFNTPEFDAFENMYFEKSREVNFFIYSMAKKYNFECRIKNKEFESYELSISDSVLVKNFLTLSPRGGSRSNTKNGILEVSNYDLKLVFKELMRKNIIVSGLETMPKKFDLTLDMNTIEALKKSFAQQGFTLINKGRMELPVFEIEFK